MPDCRLQMKHEGLMFPKSCPTCGLAKVCPKGFEEVRLPTGAFDLRRLVLALTAPEPLSPALHPSAEPAG